MGDAEKVEWGKEKATLGDKPPIKMYNRILSIKVGFLRFMWWSRLRSCLTTNNHQLSSAFGFIRGRELRWRTSDIETVFNRGFIKSASGQKWNGVLDSYGMTNFQIKYE